MDALEYCIEKYDRTYNRLVDLQNQYDNVFDKDLFPTDSKMGIPSLFPYVQEVLPAAMDMVFPESRKLYTLLPQDGDVDDEVLQNVESALNYTVRHRMNAKYTALPSITNALKTCIGYSAIVPYNISPISTINRRFTEGSRTVGRDRVVGIGRKRKTLVLEDVGLGEIIPSDDGTDFNGHDRVSHSFRIKLYNEAAFRRLFAARKADTEDIDVEGDVEAIIQEAKDFHFYTTVNIPEIVSKLGGQDIRDRQRDTTDALGAVIPVVQCYGEQEHAWIANGTTLIYHETDTLQTLHVPLIKWSTAVDSNKWQPMNAAEAGQTIAKGKNLYVNMLFDLMMKAIRGVTIYDKSKFGGKPPQPTVRGEIGTDGPIGDALQYNQGPQLNQGHLQFKEVMDTEYGRASGQPVGSQDVTTGMMRSGLHAFESLLTTTQGRARVANMIMEMGAVQPLGVLTLIHMQIMADGTGDRFSEREYDYEAGKERIKKTEVSYEDLQHAYEVSVDTRGKTRGVVDFGERIQIYQATQNDPVIDPYWRRELLIGDDYEARRALPSRERAREIEEQQRAQQQAAAQQQQSGGGPPGGIAQATTQGALEGAV